MVNPLENELTQNTNPKLTSISCHPSKTCFALDIYTIGISILCLDILFLIGNQELRIIFIRKGM